MTPMKYPSTPHWPWSEKVHRGDTYHTNPDFFVGREVVVTEKLDGGNTCLYNGEVFARSTTAPSHDGWMAMVRKHHAYKSLADQGFRAYYGEDLYGIHSIEYDAIDEDKTFYLFACREFGDGLEKSLGLEPTDWFAAWDIVEQEAQLISVPTVPVVFKGTFSSTDEITEFFREQRKLPSALGPEAEGFVMRDAERFGGKWFAEHVCKYVRPHHVQTDEHWRKNWQPCKLDRN